MTQGAAAVKPVFDASLIYMAINVLEEELEQADCFGNIQYSEIQENNVARRRVLHHESLRSDWFKVLRSGEVLLTLFRVSDKVRNLLEKHNCPMQPVLEGSEQSSWQRLRIQFRCNWQSLYSIIDYMRQYFPVTVDGLDRSGKDIVDCADVEMARTIVIGALTQCFVLFGKPSPVLAAAGGDHHRHAAAPEPGCCQPLQPLPEDSNNNAGNPSKSAVLQPKVNRLSSKKRVICIYDTTTSEDSDRASIDATPIDNRNSTDVQQQQQQQQQQQPPQQLQQPQQQVQEPQKQQQQQHEAQHHKKQHKHQHEQQQSQNQLQQQNQPFQQDGGLNVSYADGTDGSVLNQVLRRLDEVKALLTTSGGQTCQSCRQRLHEQRREAAAAAAAAVAALSNASSNAAAEDPADEASDSASMSPSGPTSPPQLRQAKIGHALVATPAVPLAPPVVNMAAALAAAAVAAPLPPQHLAGAVDAAKPSRRRSIRKGTSKRVAVQATQLVAGHAVPADAAEGASASLRRSRTLETARSVDADIHSQQPVPKKAEKLGGKNRAKVLVKRRVARSKTGGGLQQQQQLEQLQLQVQLQQQLLQQQQQQQLLQHQQQLQRQDLAPLNVSAEQRAPDAIRRRAGSGDNRKKLAAQQQLLQQQPQMQVAAAPASGANSNNDLGMKPITKSTVQDLINKLQAVINEEA